jgi:putative sterol carrier protein
MTLQELTERLRQTMERSPAPEGTFKLSLKGEGFIYVSGANVTNEDLPADCTLIIGKPDLDAMLDGSLDSQTALMNGRLVLQGDVGVAANMQGPLVAAWVQH